VSSVEDMLALDELVQEILNEKSWLWEKILL
jgi:hypothetical protein